MFRLVVEENRIRRAFRVGDGVLTIGTGAEARMRLKSPDVAEVHAELHVHGASVKLRPRPGVVPPRMGEREVQGELVLLPRQAVTMGGALLWLEGADGPLQGPLEANAAQPMVADTTDRAIQREAAIARTMAKPRKRTVTRTKPRTERGMLGWLIAVLVLGGVGIAGFFLSQGLKSSSESMGRDGIRGTLDAAREMMDAGNFELAERRLGNLPVKDLSPAQKEEVSAMRGEMSERIDQQSLDVENMKGTQYLEVLLVRYEKNHLQGEPERSKVRLFLQRCEEFRSRWPQHPRLDWIERQERRFAGFVDLSEPRTFEDMEWEIKALVNTSPRNYARAFTLIEEYIQEVGTAAGRDARLLRETLEEERVEYHTDRIHQAEYEYDKKENPAGAIWWLIHSVIWLGDEEMEQEAADILLRMPRLDEHLRGYKLKHPGKFEALMENASVQRYAKKKGLL